MSTANRVPETWKLTGSDAIRTARNNSTRQLTANAFRRLRFADGFSHARSLAFVNSLGSVQGIIAVLGVAGVVGTDGARRAFIQITDVVVPGPAQGVVDGATHQAAALGSQQEWFAVIIGAIGALVTTTTALGQLERGLNRIYGIEQDRPTRNKYGRAAILALVSLVLVGIVLATLAFSRQVGDELDLQALSFLWAWLRLPFGFVVLTLALAVIFRHCPRRRQPALSWLFFGALVSATLVVLASLALALFFRLSSDFGRTYGPLAGIVALMLWNLVTAISVFFGAAMGAQLEAVHAHADSEPQDRDKVIDSEPLIVNTSALLPD